MKPNQIKKLKISSNPTLSLFILDLRQSGLMTKELLGMDIEGKLKKKEPLLSRWIRQIKEERK